MSANTTTRTSGAKLDNQLAEDPFREPHEKETGLHLEGDGTHFSVTSFRRVVYEKLLQRPEFNVTTLHVLDASGREYTVQGPDEVAGHQDLTIIGVQGRLPVGCLTVGTPRNSNSHAGIVK